MLDPDDEGNRVMSWAVGTDIHGRHRFIGYGVPAHCDYPGCESRINRGLAHACGGDNFGDWCGLHFCAVHLVPVLGGAHDGAQVCQRCAAGQPAFTPSREALEWVEFLLEDATWEAWRHQNPEWVAELLRHAA